MGVLQNHHYYDTDMMERPNGPERLRYSLGNYQGQLAPTGAHVTRVRERASSVAEAEVGTRANWRVTRSDRGKMALRRGARRGGGKGGRGAERGQPEEQPAVPATDPNAPSPKQISP
ncbi:hypothetical protein E5676_scaffold455G002840 [Cucumis melo var. makuwa]|uniref:Uncharacterized protein n=1 Tax=Cucumis melo var. makuwa TaxID=1194695 RepID=A0A5D3E555_CUCMM|nr:hypothetical protein E6C27_scaffold285G001470 [Cucumis melo var. makuwa]TYK31032.1 hypothetical protein E5676_scaffold455G002840 [Cucumis melo var. makuwa]